MYIICIHRMLEEDLMFWDTIIARLAESDEKCILVVGAGEREEQDAASSLRSNKAGVTERTDMRVIGYELGISDSGHAERYEQSMRSRGKKILQKLSDAGISSSMVLGSDRGLLSRGPGDGIKVSRFAGIRDFVLAGVVTVIMSCGRDEGHNIVDLDPLLVTRSLYLLSEKDGDIDKVHNVLLVRDSSDSGRAIVAGATHFRYESEAELPAPLGTAMMLLGSTSPVEELEIRVTTPPRIFSGLRASLTLQ